MSPEHDIDGICSEKSDVFSFGIMVLEIVSGDEELKPAFIIMTNSFVLLLM